MATGLIRWKQGDYISLGRAVSNFNKKIKELETEENKTYLPNLVNYQDIKEDIKTRQELNRVVNSLRRFSSEGAEDLYITKAGEKMTNWERKELGIQARAIQNRLQGQLKQLYLKGERGYAEGYMGSPEINRIESQLKRYKNIENKIGSEFKRLKENIKYFGKSDYEMKKALVFRENYLNEMTKYSYFEGYDDLMKKLKSISNPLSFYEFVSQNDLSGDLTYQSEQYYSQQEFSRFIADFGIEIEKDISN